MVRRQEMRVLSNLSSQKKMMLNFFLCIYLCQKSADFVRNLCFWCKSLYHQVAAARKNLYRKMVTLPFKISKYRWVFLKIEHKRNIFRKIIALNFFNFPKIKNEPLSRHVSRCFDSVLLKDNGGRVIFNERANIFQEVAQICFITVNGKV